VDEDKVNLKLKYGNRRSARTAVIDPLNADSNTVLIMLIFLYLHTPLIPVGYKSSISKLKLLDQDANSSLPYFLASDGTGRFLYPEESGKQATFTRTYS